jgi:hypothetical protein
MNRYLSLNVDVDVDADEYEVNVISISIYFQILSLFHHINVSFMLNFIS